MNELTFDTTPILWWLHIVRSLGDEPKLATPDRQQRFLDLIRGRPITLAAPAFGEALTQFPLADRPPVEAAVRAEIAVIPFDIDAAIALVGVYETLGGRVGLKALAATHQSTRQRIKVDYQILAVARMKAHELVSADTAVIAAGPRVGVTTFDLYNLSAPSP